MDRRMAQDLDNYITGHWGEDSVSPDPQEGVCEQCGSTIDVTFGPDPYAQEIGDDETPVWLCAICIQESVDAI